MRDAQLDRLFLRFRERGDVHALTRVFDLTSRELLELASHVTRDPAQAEDLLQATFLIAIERARTYDGSRSLMPWLVGILTREARLWNRRAARRIDPASLHPRRVEEPNAQAEAAEFSSALAVAVDALGEPYRSVLVRYLRDEKSAGEIARELGRSPGTVRVQLHRGLELLRKSLPAGLVAGALGALAPRGLAAVRADVERRAALHAGPLATAGVASTAVTAFAGGLAMKHVLFLATAVLLAALLWLAWPGHSDAQSDLAARPPQASHAEPVEESTLPASSAGSELRSAITTAEAAPVSAGSGTGTLQVRVTWRDGGLPAEDVGVEIDVESAPYETTRVLELRTGPDGCVRASGIAPGSCYVELDRDCDAQTSARVNIEAGKTAELDLSLPAGIEVQGVVVDGSGASVPGASLWLSSLHRGFEGHVVGHADADGRFRLRGMRRNGQFGARSPSFAPSDLVYLLDSRLGTEDVLHVRLELLAEGGRVGGTVCDPSGAPLEHARVAIGAFLGGRQDDLAEIRMTVRTHADGSSCLAPYPAWSSTDERGAFAFEGIECGDVPLVVSSRGLAPWYGTVHVAPHALTRIDVRMQRGATLSGTVRNSGGALAAGVGVTLLGPSMLLSRSTRTDAQGRYRIDAIAPGEFRVFAGRTRAGEPGDASTVLVFGPHSQFVWDATLPGELSIVGRALDEHDAPLADWLVIARTAAEPMRALYTHTDSRGHFALAGCEEQAYTLELRPLDAAEFASPSAWQTGVHPGAREIVLRVSAATEPSARVSGRLVDARRSPVTNASVSAVSLALGRALPRVSADAGGRLDLGPLSPGSYELYFDAKDYPGRHLGTYELSPRQMLDLGEIVLDDPSRVHGRILCATGAPARAALVHLISLREHAQRLELTTREDGSYESGPLQPGSYALLVRAQGCAASRVTFEAVSGKDPVLDVRLGAGIERRLRFQTPAGQVAPRYLSCKLSNAAGESVLEESIENAECELVVTLAPGEYALEARTGNGLIARKRLDIALDGAALLEIALEREP